MSIEPGIADLVEAFEGRAAAPDWARYGLCPICRAVTGAACVSMSSSVAGGRPVGPRRELPVAHASRRVLRGR